MLKVYWPGNMTFIMHRNLEGEEYLSGAYGPELMLDWHNCDVKTMTEKSIQRYFKAIVKKIKMKKEAAYFQIGECESGQTQCPITAVQFILTSNITVHTYPAAKRVYVNIFSCKDYDKWDAKLLTWNWFKASTVGSHHILRN